MPSDTLIATETFSTEIDGTLFTVHKGQTRVREDHPLVKQNPAYFRAMDDSVHYEIEQATKAPGEKRGGSRKATKAPGEKASG